MGLLDGMYKLQQEGFYDKAIKKLDTTINTGGRPIRVMEMYRVYNKPRLFQKPELLIYARVIVEVGKPEGKTELLILPTAGFSNADTTQYGTDLANRVVDYLKTKGFSVERGNAVTKDISGSRGEATKAITSEDYWKEQYKARKS